MRLVLASSSSSRRMILQRAGVDPVIAPAHVDEDALLSQHVSSSPGDTVVALAAAKAFDVADQFPDDVVVGCDSMLLLDGVLQGKPHTAEETIKRWRAQRGKSAVLVTGHCVVLPSGGDSSRRSVCAPVETVVTFGDVSDADIEAYAASGEPWPCAGAFTLEALGGWFIDRIDGCASNVIGLSLPFLRATLATAGIDVSSMWREQGAGPQ